MTIREDHGCTGRLGQPCEIIKQKMGADYLFRLVVSRADMDAAMLREVRRINYGNFKGSVEENWRHDAYMRVWSVMHQEQIHQATRMVALPVVAPQLYADKPKGKNK